MNHHPKQHLESETVTEHTIEKFAWDIIDDNDPEVINVIHHMLQRGISPGDIADKYAKRDICLAALVEMAATLMLERIHD